MKDVLLKVRNLTIGHDGNILCSGIDFDVHKGDCIMLCGANGSGKTTLLKKIAGMKAKGDIIMIPTRIPKVPGFTLLEFIRISCFTKSNMSGSLSEADEIRIGELIGLSGLADRQDMDISHLSDGEFQKACLISALARNAAIILLDEPTAFLDAGNRRNMLQAFMKICKGEQAPAIIFSTHDLHDAVHAVTRVFAIGADRKFHCSKDESDSSLKDTVSQIFIDKVPLH